MKLKKKPAKPNKKQIKVALELDDGIMLQEVVDYFSEYDLNKVKIASDYGDEYYGYEHYYSNSYSFITYRDETDEEYASRLEKYHKNLAKWQLWYDENKEDIIEIENKKKQEKERKQLDRKIQIQNQIKNLKDELSKIK